MVGPRIVGLSTRWSVERWLGLLKYVSGVARSETHSGLSRTLESTQLVYHNAGFLDLVNSSLLDSPIITR